MRPEDWKSVSRIYLEGIATEHATFQTDCPPYAAWDASHIRECRLVLLAGGVIAGWTALQPTVCQYKAASRALNTNWGFRLVGRRERIARDCHGRWLDTYLMEYRAAADEPVGYKKL